MFKRIDHVEIVASDVERSIHFYSTVLGFRLKSRIHPSSPGLREVVYLTLGDTMVELLAPESPAPRSQEPWQVGYRSMALEVEDMDGAVKILAQKGVTPTWGPMDLGTSIRAEIQDPDGLSVELRQWKS